MSINLTPEQQDKYYEALAEAMDHQSLALDTNAAQQAIASGQISDELHQALAPYLKITRLPHLRLVSPLFSAAEKLTERMQGAGPRSLPLDLQDPRLKEILEKGIRNQKQFILALRYIETVAPQFGGELIQAFRLARSRSQINIVFEPALESKAETNLRPALFYDRDSVYSRTIRLKPGVDLLTIVGQIIHALPRAAHPIGLKANPYPAVARDVRFGEMRNQARTAFIYEVAEGYVGEFLFVDEARQHAQEIALTEQTQSLYSAYKTGGIEAVKTALANSSFGKSTELTSILIAAAGKLKKEDDPDFLTQDVFDLLSAVTGKKVKNEQGEVDLNLIPKALYVLYQQSSPELNTLELALKQQQEAARFVNPGEIALDFLVEGVENLLDGPRERSGFILLKKLQSARSLGSRPQPVNISKDRGYLNNPEVAVPIATGWAHYLEYLAKAKEEGKIESRHFTENLLHLAEYAPDPLAGELFGQAWVLAHEQAVEQSAVDGQPRVLIDLAESLMRASYMDKAEEALEDYVEIALKPRRALIRNSNGAEEVRQYLDVVKKFPIPQQIRIVQNLFAFGNPYTISDKQFRDFFEGMSSFWFGKNIHLTQEEKLETQALSKQGLVNPDFQAIHALFVRVATRMAIDPAQVGPEVSKAFHESIISLHLHQLETLIPLSNSLLEIAQRWPAGEAQDLKDQFVHLDKAVRSIPQLSAKLHDLEERTKTSPEDLAKTIRAEEKFWDNGAMLRVRSRYTLLNSELAVSYLYYPAYAELGFEIIDEMPNLPEKLIFLTNRLNYNFKNLSSSQKVRLLETTRQCALAVATRDLQNPGITKEEFQDKPDQKKTLSSSYSFRQKTPQEPVHPEQTWIYNHWLGQIAAVAFKDSDSTVQDFARDSLRGIYQSSDAYEDLTFGVDFQSSPPFPIPIGQDYPPKTYIPDFHRFEIISELLTAKKDIGASDLPFVEEVLNFYDAHLNKRYRRSEMNEFGKSSEYMRRLFVLTERVTQLGDRTIAERAIELSSRIVTYSGRYINQSASVAKQRYENSERFLHWQDLTGRGELASLKGEMDAFLEALRRDLKGTTTYDADELTQFLSLVDRIKALPEREETIVAILGHAIERYAKQSGDVRYRNEQAWGYYQEKSYYRSDLKSFVEVVESIDLPPDTKDKLFVRLIEKMTPVMLEGRAYSFDTLRTAQGLREYFKQGRYPKTDEVIYSRMATIIGMARTGADSMKSADIFTATSYFSGVLAENPWLMDANSYPVLAGHSAQPVYLRALMTLYPSQNAHLKQSVLNPDNTLNLEGVKTGLVEIADFRKTVFEKMGRGELTGEPLTQAIAALIKGEVYQAGKAAGSLAQLEAKFSESFGTLWQMLSHEFVNQGVLSEKGKSIFAGVLEGFGGDSMRDRTLFFTGLLQDSQIPLESKKEVWKKLYEGKIISPLADNYLKRYVQSKEPTFQESDYYRIIGKMIELNGGSFPQPEAIALLAKNPQEHQKYLEAMEKWARVKEKRYSGEVTLDLSNIYEVFFFGRFCNSVVNEEVSGDFLKTRGYLEELLQKGEPYEWNKQVKIHLTVSNPSLKLNVEQRSSDLFLQRNTTVFEEEFWKLNAFAILEGEPLPLFIEEFPLELRKVIGGAIAQLPVGRKIALFEEFKDLEREGKSKGALLRKLLETLGWAKVGQILSIFPHLSPEVQKELETLQDNVPHSKPEEIRSMLKSRLGKFYDEIEELQLPPIHSASIGEVVKARLKDGRWVAIKVITNERRAAIGEMLNCFKNIMILMRKAGYTRVMGISVSDFFSKFHKMIDQETNLNLEWQYHRNYELPEGMRKPELIYPRSYSSLEGIESVLVMEWVDGKKLLPENVSPEHIEKITKQLISLARKPFQTNLDLRYDQLKSFYQGDPHPGNFLIDSDGNIVLLDFGQVQEAWIDEPKNLIALSLEDSSSFPDRVEKIVSLLIKMSDMKYREKEEQQAAKELLIKRIDSFLSKTQASKSSQKISNRILEFFAEAEECKVIISSHYYYLVKYFSTLESTIQQFDPSFDIRTQFAPEVHEYLETRTQNTLESPPRFDEVSEKEEVLEHYDPIDQVCLPEQPTVAPEMSVSASSNDTGNISELELRWRAASVSASKAFGYRSVGGSFPLLLRMGLGRGLRVLDMPEMVFPPLSLQLGKRTLEGTMHLVSGSLTFGIGELGSSFVYSLFSPTHPLPSADEMVKNFGTMSLGGGIGKVATDGVINKIEGNRFLAPVSTTPGEMSVKGAARRFFPLLAAMLLDDWIKGRPIEAGKTALGITNVAIASGVTHLVGSGLRRAETVEKIARWLRLVKVGGVAASEVPAAGEVTMLGAALASVAEFTILKVIGAVEESYLNYKNLGEVQEAYAQAVRKANDLVKDIKSGNVESVNQERILTVRSDLEKAAAYYQSYFQSRITQLETEQEKQIKELEEDHREYLLNRGGRSVFEINQMYDEKIRKLNEAFSEKIEELEDPEQQIQFYKLPLNNLYKIKPELNMSFIQTPQPAEEEEDKDNTQALIYPLKERLAGTQSAFLAQHENYLNDLREFFQKIIEREVKDNPELQNSLNLSGSSSDNLSSESLIPL